MPYLSVGRCQTEAESDAMRIPMETKLRELGVTYQVIKGNESDYDLVVDQVMHQLNLRQQNS